MSSACIACRSSGSGDVDLTAEQREKDGPRGMDDVGRWGVGLVASLRAAEGAEGAEDCLMIEILMNYGMHDRDDIVRRQRHGLV